MKAISERTWPVLAGVFLCISSVAPASAQTAEEADPPDRAARLSLFQGDVSVQPVGQDEWANAIVNRPLTTGDKLWTDEGARAEVQVGPATVRLGSNTGFSFLNVDDDTIQMRVTAGVLGMRVRSLDEHDQIEIDTPNLALSILRPGNYRVEVNDAGDTTVVKVSDGEAEATGGSQDVVVHAQQSATFRGTDRLASDFGTLGAPDAFDSWGLERDRIQMRAESSPSAQYVSPDVTGYEDLDSNGSWSADPEYGNVWTPTVVAVDWSPYRYGRWAWVAPWGWTWIDDAPWGYAPFHYGRWARVRDRWCWVPGPRQVRAVYAPALVAWVGTPGLSVTISAGGGAGVAWFPLGPREVYVPSRRFSPRYVERVNVSNTVIVNKTYITNVYNNRVTNIEYRNRAVPGAVTVVSRTTFTSAQPVGRHMVRVDERELTRVHATGAAPRIEPARQSVLGVNDAARRNMRLPPPTVRDRQVVTKRAPPAAAAHFVRNPGQQPVPGRQEADPGRAAQTQRDAQAQRDSQTRRDAQAQRDVQAQRGAQVQRDTQVQRDAQARRDDAARRGQPPPVRNDRPPSAADRGQPRQNGPEQSAQREPQAQRGPQAQRDQQPQREQQMQGDQQAREQRAQQLQRQQQAQQQQAQREQVQQQQQAQRAQQAQRDQQAQRAQQAQQQAQRAQQAQREQQAQRDQQAQRAQQAQREQQAQRDAQSRRTAAAQSREQANVTGRPAEQPRGQQRDRPEPERRPEPRKPPDGNDSRQPPR